MLNAFFAIGIFGVLAFIAFIWLVVIAFQRSVGWGFLVLLLSPLTAIIYSVLYWREARLPFVIFMAALAIQISYTLSTLRDLGGAQVADIAQRVQRGELDGQQAAEETSAALVENMHRNGLIGDRLHEGLRREIERNQPQQADNRSAQEKAQRTGAEPTKAPPAVDGNPDAAAGRTAPTAKDGAVIVTLPKAVPPAKPKPIFIPVTEAGNYIGKAMIVVTRDGNRREGILLEARGDILVFDRPYHGGNVTYKIATRDIGSIQLKH